MFLYCFPFAHANDLTSPVIRLGARTARVQGRSSRSIKGVLCPHPRSLATSRTLIPSLSPPLAFASCHPLATPRLYYHPLFDECACALMACSRGETMPPPPPPSPSPFTPPMCRRRRHLLQARLEATVLSCAVTCKDAVVTV